MYPARRRSMLYEGMHRTIIYKALFVRTSALFSLSLLSIRSSRLPAPHTCRSSHFSAMYMYIHSTCTMYYVHI